MSQRSINDIEPPSWAEMDNQTQVQAQGQEEKVEEKKVEEVEKKKAPRASTSIARRPKAQDTERYSDHVEDDVVSDLRKIIARMVSGGFATAKGGGSRRLTDQEKFAIASVARHYGLDPLMGDIYLLGDNPYISTKALQRLAVESGRLERAWKVRPFTQPEAEMWQLREGEFGAVAEVWVKGIQGSFVGMGTAHPTDVGILQQRGGGY